MGSSDANAAGRKVKSSGRQAVLRCKNKFLHSWFSQKPACWVPELEESTEFSDLVTPIQPWGRKETREMEGPGGRAERRWGADWEGAGERWGKVKVFYNHNLIFFILCAYAHAQWSLSSNLACGVGIHVYKLSLWGQPLGYLGT